MADFVTPVVAALPFLAGLFGGGGDDQAAPTLDPVLRQQLLMAMLAQGRQNVLVDPAAAKLFGFESAPSDAVPLRSAANQLAFALLPNFVRPENSLFPGTAPATGSIDHTPSAAFVNPQVGDADPGGSGPGGTTTQEDIARRDDIADIFAEEIASGNVSVLPNGRIQLTGFDDLRGRIPRVNIDDLRRRLTPQSGGRVPATFQR